MELVAGTDFFTAEVLTLRGLVTYYVMFFIYLESRRVYVAGITVHPNELWMKQIARNATMDDCGALRDCGFLPTRSGHEIHPVVPRNRHLRSG